MGLSDKAIQQKEVQVQGEEKLKVIFLIVGPSLWQMMGSGLEKVTNRDRR